MAGWFGPRGDGIGFGPRSWQGWLVSALLIGGAVMEAKVFHPAQFGLPGWIKPALAAALGLAYLLVIYLTYDDG